jgi:hypothetical protein
VAIARRRPRAALGDWTKALPEAGFTAVAMDQRNASASRTAIEATCQHDLHQHEIRRQKLER